MGAAALLVGLAMLFAVPGSMNAEKKKADKPAEVPIWKRIDFSMIVWPNPPEITRVRYLDYFSAEKFDKPKEEKKKGAWMDRMAGVAAGESKSSRPHYQLAAPYGLAVDSKGRLYVADEKVGAIFIFNTETRDVELIKNGTHAKFSLISGLAIDDADHLYVSDGGMRHVLVFDPQHKAEAVINEGLANPAGIAIDNENRLLYVADSDLDQVLVYDADSPHKLLRKMGTAGTKHTSTAPGDFSHPTNLAVDSEGNLYVSDTFNDRVEIFDADGNFESTFGKAGDGPGYFSRPKGIGIDCDGHIWVADGVQDRVQVFNREGRVLLFMGGHGLLPGQFSAVAGLTIDKTNRVFTSEQYIGRVQMFRYIPNGEAKAEQARREAEEQKKKAGGKPAVQVAPAPAKPQDSAAK
jgi:DNA-binding beta-propeller fold protein YncE